MPKYCVDIREVHISDVVVEVEEGTSEEDIYRAARKKHEDLDTLDVNYSHTMDEKFWTLYSW